LGYLTAARQQLAEAGEALAQQQQQRNDQVYVIYSYSNHISDNDIGE
jgi:hypothetical protein